MRRKWRIQEGINTCWSRWFIASSLTGRPNQNLEQSKPSWLLNTRPYRPKKDDNKRQERKASWAAKTRKVKVSKPHTVSGGWNVSVRAPLRWRLFCRVIPSCKMGTRLPSEQAGDPEKFNYYQVKLCEDGKNYQPMPQSTSLCLLE